MNQLATDFTTNDSLLLIFGQLVEVCEWLTTSYVAGNMWVVVADQKQSYLPKQKINSVSTSMLSSDAYGNYTLIINYKITG